MTGDAQLTLYASEFSGGAVFSSTGSTAADAIRQGEAAQGGRIFIGHTELLCLDGSRTLADVENLLLHHGLPPACKLLYTQVEDCFTKADTGAVLESVRMAERGGLLAVTDSSTVLEEWLGSRQTALLPALSDTGLKMVLLRTDGECTVLSPEAAQGMYWLRRHGNTDFSMTVRMGQNMEDVRILRSTLRKTLSDGKLCYKVGVITDNCPETVKPALRMLILRQCRAAVSEMRSARADVIGMETLAAYGGIAFTDAVEIGVEVY
jgi:hypothetical protein